MKRDLRGIGSDRRRAGEPRESARPAEPPAQTVQTEQNAAGTVNEAINQYGGRSDAELMGELVNFKKSGVLDDDKLAEVYQRLTPLLNEQQRKRLESVIGTLRNT